MTAHIFAPEIIAASKGWIQGLSSEDTELIRSAIGETIDLLGELNFDLKAELIEILEAKGATITELTLDQKQAWAESSLEFYENYAFDVAPDLLLQILEELPEGDCLIGTAILLISFAILLLLSLPITFALGVSSVLTQLVTVKIPLDYVAQGMFTTLDSYALLAVSLFVFSALIMKYGGLSRRLIYVARAFVGHYRGGLATVDILAATIFALLSGSSPATVAAI